MKELKLLYNGCHDISVCFFARNDNFLVKSLHAYMLGLWTGFRMLY
jgi:hypothetical protein